MASTVHGSHLINILDIDLLVEQVYGHSAGHIWLINSDLRVLKNKHLFGRHYLKTLARRPYEANILGIWHAFSAAASAEFEREIATQSSRITKNLRDLHGGNPRIFDKLRFVVLPSQAVAALKNIPLTLYTVGDTVRSVADNNGVAIARPPVPPFVHSRSAGRNGGSNGELQVGVSWWFRGDSEPGTALRQRIHAFAIDYLEGCDGQKLEQDGTTFRLVPAQDVHSPGSISEVAASWAQPLTYEIGVVCALPEETAELVKVLDGARVVLRGKRVYHCGYVGDGPHPLRAVITTADRMGNVDAAISTLQLLASFQPSRIILTGICAGVKGTKNANEQEMKLGDVVISNSVLGYEYEKTQPKDDHKRWRECRPGGAMIALAEQLALGERAAQAWVGGVLSGEKVMNDGMRAKRLAKEAKKFYGVEVYGFEMESFGFGSGVAAWHEKVEWVMIKGVSDWASKKGTDSDRVSAKTNARTFLLDLIKMLPTAEGPDDGR